MALPTSRNTTYAAGSQVKSADLNALQDQFIGGKHPLMTLQVSPAAFRAGAGVGAVTYSLGETSQASTVYMIAPIVVPVGTRIVGVRIYGKDSATGPSKFMGVFAESNPLTGATLIASTPISAGTGAYQSLACVSGSLAFPYVALASRVYQLAFQGTTGAAAQSVFGAEIDVDRL